MTRPPIPMWRRTWQTVRGRLLARGLPPPFRPAHPPAYRAQPELVDASGPAGDAGLGVVTEILDPVLVPLGFAPGQVGGEGRRGQVIFCRGDVGSPDGGCIDLVLEVQAMPDWQITDVRYWGFPSDRWHLDFDRAAQLPDQLAGLARTLPSELR